MGRILPIHPDTVNPRWTSDTLMFEAQKNCKPFFVIFHRCLDTKIRSQEQVEACKKAPELMDRCVNDVLKDMYQIIEKKKSGEIRN